MIILRDCPQLPVVLHFGNRNDITMAARIAKSISTATSVAFLSVALSFLLLDSVAGAVSGNRDESRLRHELFEVRKINRHVRPVYHFSEVVKVKVELTGQHMALNAKNNILNLGAWLSLEWKDKNLVWTAGEYANITVIRVLPSLIWKPDITILNSAVARDPFPFSQTQALLRHNGVIRWIPPASFNTFCRVNVHHFPFDEHECVIKLGSSTHDQTLIDLEVSNSTNGVQIDMLKGGKEWETVGTSVVREEKHYPCCPYPFANLQFKLNLRRLTPYYQVALLVPASMALLLTLAVFWLPPMAGEKITLSGFNIIIFFLLLTHTYWVVPRNGDSPPNFVLFCGISLVFATIALILSITTLNMSRSCHTNSAPAKLKNLLSGSLGGMLCLGKGFQMEQHNGDNFQAFQADSPTTNQQDWVIMAAALDRLFFFLYCIMFVILIAASFH